MPFLKRVLSMRVVMFIVIATVLMIFSFFRNITVYPYDSSYYWHIADPVFENTFDILDFPETFRGYFFPVLVGMVKYTVIRLGVSNYWGWRLLISAMISGVLVYAFPIIFKKNNNTHVGWADYLANTMFILIFSVFWGDFIQYPLSDFPACFFMLMGIATLFYIKDRPNCVCKVAGGIIGGILLYAAYNTRVAFLYGELIVIIVFVVYILREKSYKNFLILISLIIGMSCAAMPQMMINHQYIGNWSLKVYTEQVTGYKRGLEVEQVFWGLECPRYETYFGDFTDYPSEKVFFDDPIGKKIIGIEGDIGERNYSNIFKLFLKYPLDVGGLYIRHLISLMTPIFDQVYILDMYTDKGIFISLAIIIWMIAAADIILVSKRFDHMTLYLLVALLVPSLLQLAGAPELRFFLMVYLLLYYYIVNMIDYKKLFQSIKRRWLPVAIVCTAVYFVWISYTGMMLSYNRETVLIINDKHYENISESE